LFLNNKMGNSVSFSFRPAVDTILRLSRARLGGSAQVVLVLDERADVFVLVANVQSPSALQREYQWFLVQGQTGRVSTLGTADLCGYVTRSRRISRNAAFLGELALHTRLPTLSEMQQFAELCINPSPPQEKTLQEASETSS
jgi:hypothetical protein